MTHSQVWRLPSRREGAFGCWGEGGALLDLHAAHCVWGGTACGSQIKGDQNSTQDRLGWYSTALGPKFCASTGGAGRVTQLSFGPLRTITVMTTKRHSANDIPPTAALCPARDGAQYCTLSPPPPSPVPHDRSIPQDRNQRTGPTADTLLGIPHVEGAQKTNALPFDVMPGALHQF